MAKKPNMTKIARGLRAKRGQKVAARGGYFGALQVATEVATRFRAPATGGRPTDPRWTERRLRPLSPETRKRLEELAARFRKQGLKVEPMQLAALLLERSTERLEPEDVEKLMRAT
jgi:hypothetical protein